MFPKIHDLIYPTKEELESVYPEGSDEVNQSHIFIVMEHKNTDLRKLLE